MEVDVGNGVGVLVGSGVGVEVGVEVGDGLGVDVGVLVGGTGVDVAVGTGGAASGLLTDSTAETCSPDTRYRCTSVTPAPFSPSTFGTAARSALSCVLRNSS